MFSEKRRVIATVRFDNKPVRGPMTFSIMREIGNQSRGRTNRQSAE